MMTAEERQAKIQSEVYNIANRYFDAMYEAFDRLDKGRANDATATDIIKALRKGGYDEVADGYEDWLSEGLANERKTDDSAHQGDRLSQPE